jgi:integrase
MSFAYLPKGRKTWHIGFHDPVTGKFRHESARTRIESVARKKAKEHTAKLLLNIPDDSLVKQDKRTVLLSVLFQMFLESKTFSARTIYNYKIVYKHLIQAVGDKPIYKVSSDDNLALTKYLNSRAHINPATKIAKPLSSVSKATYFRHLHVFFSWLLKNKYITENFIIIPKAEKKETRIIPQSDLDLIFEDLKKTNIKQYNIAKFKYLAALRAGEILTLHVEDIDLQKSILTVNNSKGKRTDRIPIPADLSAHIASMRINGSGLLFPALNYMIIKTFWARSMRRLGFNYNIHMLRKTRGTVLAESGVNPFFLRDFMRHESLKTTEQYYISINIDKARQDINAKLSKK